MQVPPPSSPNMTLCLAARMLHFNGIYSRLHDYTCTQRLSFTESTAGQSRDRTE